MPIDVKQTVESSSAVNIAPSDPVARQEWQKTGIITEPKKEKTSEVQEPKSGDSASPPPPEEASSVAEEKSEATPESETGEGELAKQADEPKQEEEKRGTFTAAEKRKAQLNAEIRTLIKQRDELRKEAAPPPKVEAKPEVTAGKATKQDSIPLLDNYDTPEEWAKAVAEFVKEQTSSVLAEERKKAEKEAQEAEFAASRKQAVDAWDKRVSAAVKKHADFHDVAKEAITLIPRGSVLDIFLLKSEIGPEMLYHLGQDAEELERIGSLDAFEQHHELAKLEISLTGTSSPAKKVTGASKPPTDLGAKGTAPADPLAAAMKETDPEKRFGMYHKIVNQEEQAARRR